MKHVQIYTIAACIAMACTNPVESDKIDKDDTDHKEIYMTEMIPIPLRDHYYYTDDKRLLGITGAEVDRIQPVQHVTITTDDETVESAKTVRLDTFCRDSGRLYYTVPHQETKSTGETVETTEYIKQDGETVTTLAKEHKAPALQRAVYESANYRVTVEEYDGRDISAVYHGDKREPLVYVSEAVEVADGLLMSVRESGRSTRPEGLVLWQRTTGHMVKLHPAVGRLY
jgi:hypothetical protein